MLEKMKSKKKYGRMLMLSMAMAVCFCFPAFASSGGTADLTTLTTTFTTIATWLWDSVGDFATFVLAQPLLLIALGIPFVGLIVNFFLRIFKSV